MSPAVKAWAAAVPIFGVLALAYVGLGYLFPGWFLVAITLIGGGAVLLKALQGELTTYLEYEWQPHQFVAVLVIWGALALMWLGYYINHGHLPL